MTDSHHSELEKNKKKLGQYVKAIEQTVGNDTRVVGILEIGSFANGEGTELSDIDTRIYLESENAYIWNVEGHKSSEAIYNEHKKSWKNLPNNMARSQ